MKKIILLFSLTLFTISLKAQTVPVAVKDKIVDIACGECKFKMLAGQAGGKGKGCDLAIKMDGKTYFVDGKTVDDFGDAHAKHGFCNAVSKATVTGEIINNRFKATTITLIPSKKKA